MYQPGSCNNFEEKGLDSTPSSKNGCKEFAEKVGSLYVICLCESETRKLFLIKMAYFLNANSLTEIKRLLSIS